MITLASLGRAALTLSAALIGITAGLGALLGAATITDRPPQFLLAGLLAFCTTYLLGLLFPTRRIASSRKRRVRAALFCTGTALIVGAFAWATLVPLDDPRLPPPLRGNDSGSFRPAPGSPTCASPQRATSGRCPSSSCTAAPACRT
jgi:hypothetical protein